MTWASRGGMVEAVAADSNAELRSTVAVPFPIRRLSSLVPAGIADRTPALCSAAVGPLSMASRAVRPIAVLDGSTRWVTKSWPERVSQISMPAEDADEEASPGDGPGPLAGCAGVLAETAGLAPVPTGGESAVGAGPVGAGPSEAADPVPQAAVSSPIPTIKVARRFMANLPSVAVTPTLGLPANRRLTVASRFVHRAGLGSGRISRNCDPMAMSRRTWISPPSSLAFSWAMARPSPLPEPAREESAL